MGDLCKIRCHVLSMTNTSSVVMKCIDGKSGGALHLWSTLTMPFLRIVTLSNSMMAKAGVVGILGNHGLFHMVYLQLSVKFNAASMAHRRERRFFTPSARIPDRFQKHEIWNHSVISCPAVWWFCELILHAGKIQSSLPTRWKLLANRLGSTRQPYNPR